MHPSFWIPVEFTLADWAVPLLMPLVVAALRAGWSRWVRPALARHHLLPTLPDWMGSVWFVAVLLFAGSAVLTRTRLVADWNVSVLRWTPSAYSPFYLLSDVSMVVLAGLFIRFGRPAMGAAITIGLLPDMMFHLSGEMKNEVGDVMCVRVRGSRVLSFRKIFINFTGGWVFPVGGALMILEFFRDTAPRTVQRWPLHSVTSRMDWIGLLIVLGYVHGFEFAALHHHPHGWLLSPNRAETSFDQIHTRNHFWTTIMLLGYALHAWRKQEGTRKPEIIAAACAAILAAMAAYTIQVYN